MTSLSWTGSVLSSFPFAVQNRPKRNLFLGIFLLTFLSKSNEMAYLSTVRTSLYAAACIFFYPISKDHFFIFKEVFFRKFCPYLCLVFKSGLWWRTFGICIGKKSFIYISMVARVSKDRLRCKSTTNFGEDDETLQWHLCHEPEVSSLVFR